jgi:hypothetical protein
MDRRSGVCQGGVLSRQLQIDIGMKDLASGFAASIAVGCAEKLIEVTKVGHQAVQGFDPRLLPSHAHDDLATVVRLCMVGKRRAE